jgi:hypothetical protein
MDEPKNQPTKTVTDRLEAVLRQFAEQQKPAVQTGAKHMDHAAAKVLASVNPVFSYRRVE